MTQNITFSGKPERIKQMRELARAQDKTFNQLFQEWMEESVAKKAAANRAKHVKAIKESFEQFSFKSERKYTREEMNQR